MPAQPTGRLGLLRIPAPDANKVEMRFAPLAQRDKFAPAGWPVRELASVQPAFPGWWEIDIDALDLADGPLMPLVALIRLRRCRRRGLLSR